MPHIDLTPPLERKSGCLVRDQTGEFGPDTGVGVAVVVTGGGLEVAIPMGCEVGIFFAVGCSTLKSGNDEVKSRRLLSIPVELVIWAGGGTLRDCESRDGAFIVALCDISGVLDR